ncbi:hypothetical protein IE53DRAFT_385438 [Violaceomyces palustris]|uniref:Uncharacterized protein n=1 Tax=Violaceomyces palustris TaxID=1673888 RepID=A0ACD0P255_9BASI|nr:hypothetical protein IE53DRAFT_385438 [Violaceomyces palustris]
MLSNLITLSTLSLILLTSWTNAVVVDPIPSGLAQSDIAIVRPLPPDQYQPHLPVLPSSRPGQVTPTLSQPSKPTLILRRRRNVQEDQVSNLNATIHKVKDLSEKGNSQAAKDLLPFIETYVRNLGGTFDQGTGKIKLGGFEYTFNGTDLSLVQNGGSGGAVNVTPGGSKAGNHDGSGNDGGGAVGGSKIPGGGVGCVFQSGGKKICSS